MAMKHKSKVGYMVVSNYYQMYNLFLNDCITENEWYTYCNELLFSMPELIVVL